MADVSLAELEKGMKSGEKQISQEQIMSEFWTGKNLEYKTEINNPLAMAVLDSMGDYIEDEWGAGNAKYFRSLLKWYRINMVSHKRKSRFEVIQFARAGMGVIAEAEKKMSEKLLGR